MSMVGGLRIYKGKETRTNEAGEFTLAVRVPKVPFIGFDFDFGTGEHIEQVSLSSPFPFVSLFNPNQKKIFYVPGSKVRDKFGLLKTYFTDEREAAQAFGLQANTTTSSTQTGDLFQAAHTIVVEGLGKLTCPGKTGPGCML